MVDFEVGTKDIIICDERKGNIITEYIEEKKGEGILVEEADEVMNEQKKTPRIRKSSDRIARDIRKHEIPPACSCKRKCIEKVIEIERVVIHEGFWQKSYDDRACFIHSRMKRCAIKRRRIDSKGLHGQHEYSFVYSFEVSGVPETVCQKFFLSTLGFKSHSVLDTVVAKGKGRGEILPLPDKRGKASPTNKFSQEDLADVQAHIMSYSPSISHYRRVHAPLRLYLPAQLTIASMHKEYIEGGGKGSYKFYRKEVQAKNISFAKLGEEKCEDCLKFQEHSCVKEVGTPNDDCDDAILTMSTLSGQQTQGKIIN